MPNYEYMCEECGHKFETFQSMTADPLKECPECKKEALRKVISAGMGVVIGENFKAHHDRIKRTYGKG
jgi:putative FmdB family regulatory protein